MFSNTARCFERLGTFARVVLFDRRGTGLSDAVSRPPTLEQQVVIAERGKQVRRLALVGEQVIVAYADGHVAVHGRAGWEAHADEASGLAVRPSGQQLATGGWDGRVALWSLSGETLGGADLGVEVADVAFLGEDRLLALHQLPETGVTVLSLRG